MTPAEILKQFNNTMNSYIAAEENYRVILNPANKEKCDIKIQVATYAKTVLKNICKREV